MRNLSLLLLSSIGSILVAQTPTPAVSAAPAPAGPVIKWRGAIWTSGAISDRQTADGSLFMRPVDAGNGQLSVDGAQLGADVTLTSGWSVKATILGGNTAKVLNAADGESGNTLAFSEAQLIWTGTADTFKLGRMWTPMGMEVMDQTQNIMATRGILFTFAIPFSQVGVDWHHAFSTSWSTDVYVFNGEDRVKDNNRSKTAGLSLSYNHGGASDKFVTLMVFRGPEQDGLGTSASTGAEGRQRERACVSGQWVWGINTLQFEVETGREAFPAAAIAGAPGPGNETATWKGGGLIYKAQFNDAWALLARAEVLKDDTGVRFSYDTSVAALGTTGTLGTMGADLSASSFALGVERKWGNTFARLEGRYDKLNKEVLSGTEDNLKPFKNATSLTFSLGSSF
jgi:hypothetical protein